METSSSNFFFFKNNIHTLLSIGKKKYHTILNPELKLVLKEIHDYYRKKNALKRFDSDQALMFHNYGLFDKSVLEHVFCQGYSSPLDLK